MSDKLVEYWQTNIATNYKKISAIFGSMIITFMGLTFFGIRTELDAFSILITLLFAANPFIQILVNIIFKGESELKDKEIVELKQTLVHEREISEYKLQLLGLQANADWNKYNNLIGEIDKVEKKEIVPAKTTYATAVPYGETDTDVSTL